MRAGPLSPALSPSLIAMGLFVLAVALLTRDVPSFPALSNACIAITIVLIVGMAMCAQGGIGRVAEANEWTHPLSISGYALGLLILIVVGLGLFGRPVPWVTEARSIPLAMVALMGSEGRGDRRPQPDGLRQQPPQLTQLQTQ